MTTDESLARFGIAPRDEDLPAIRALLRADIEKDDVDREPDLALLCAVQLFSRAQPDDVLLIWRAKMASMDLGCMIDIDLLCGAGVEATKTMLAARSDPDALQALRQIEACERAGDFDTFEPHRRLATYRSYFHSKG